MELIERKSTVGGWHIVGKKIRTETKIVAVIDDNDTGSLLTHSSRQLTYQDFWVAFLTWIPQW